MIVKKRHSINLAVIFVITLTAACTLASPFDQLLAGVIETPPPEVAGTLTLQPTFTPTPPVTPTPAKTSTPTLTPIPPDTPTPSPTPTLPPTDIPPPTETSTPAPPPPPTNTPLPTDTPAPKWDYQISELYTQPTDSTLLSIMVAVQGHDGGWIPGLRLAGLDPNGVVTKSEPTADQVTGYTPPSDVIKSGNTKFEPLSGYVTGTWFFHLETIDGTQVSDTYPVDMDAENRVWYFFRFQPG